MQVMDVANLQALARNGWSGWLEAMALVWNDGEMNMQTTMDMSSVLHVLPRIMVLLDIPRGGRGGASASFQVAIEWKGCPET